MRTIEEINGELEQVRAAAAKRKRLQTAWEDLKEQRREREQVERETARILKKESADVEELERMSLKALLAALKGDREERLSRERREELTARLRHDQAVQDLEEIEGRLNELAAELNGIPDPSARLRSLLEEKSAALRAQGGTAGERLAALEEELAQIRARRKEIHEAAAAGRRAREALSQMQQDLDDAERMGTWDMLGGGLLVTAAKHEHLNSARGAASEVQRSLRSFRTELADVSMRIESPTVEVGSFETFADYFFDGLLADWTVQNRIYDAQGSARSTQAKVGEILRRLEYMDQQEESRSAALERERSTILEG